MHLLLILSSITLTTAQQYYNAQVFAFDSSDKSKGPCAANTDTLIGTTLTSKSNDCDEREVNCINPSCFTIEGNTELYLCNQNKQVVISTCAKKDCTECKAPEIERYKPKTNVYDYEDGKCQTNGWLMARCTTTPAMENRFVVTNKEL